MSVIEKELRGEIQSLTEKLQLVRQWHDRCEKQLANLQQTPDKTKLLRHRVENPDVAIPLLQNYDMVIAKVEMENRRLTDQVTEMKQMLHDGKLRLDGSQATVPDQSDDLARRLAHERAEVQVEEANIRVHNLESEVHRLNGELGGVRAEASALADRLRAAEEQTAQWKASASQLTKIKDEVETDNGELRNQVTRLRHTVEVLEKKLHQQRAAEDDERNVNESQKVQLHLATKENEDKLHEIDRVRNKMMQALKQAGDNHERHLQLVEEKHRAVVEQLKEDNRALEAQLLKLRAQLARSDWTQQPSRSTSITDVVRSGQQQAQDAELKRLHAELSSAQVQRDDAIARLEQAQAMRRTEVDNKTRDLRRDNETLRQRNEELQDRLARHEKELTTARENLRAAKSENRGLVNEVQCENQEKQNTQRRAEEYRKSMAKAEEVLQRCNDERREAIETERRVARALERRVEECKRDEQALKDRHYAELTDYQKTLDETKEQLREATARLGTSTTTLKEKERTLEIMNGKCERLQTALQAHKQQLVTCDEAAGSLVESERKLRTDLREMTMNYEQQKMENVRLLRDRERLMEEVHSLNHLVQTKKLLSIH